MPNRRNVQSSNSGADFYRVTRADLAAQLDRTNQLLIPNDVARLKDLVDTEILMETKGIHPNMTAQGFGGVTLQYGASWQYEYSVTKRTGAILMMLDDQCKEHFDVLLANWRNEQNARQFGEIDRIMQNEQNEAISPAQYEANVIASFVQKYPDIPKEKAKEFFDKTKPVRFNGKEYTWDGLRWSVRKLSLWERVRGA